MENEERLETGNGPATPRGDNLYNDYVQGMADGYAALATARGDAVVDEADVMLADRSSPSFFENYAVLRRPLRDREWRAAAGRMQEFFAARPGGNFLLFSGWPTADLTALNFGLIGHPPMMVRPPGPLAVRAVDGLDIRRVDDADTAFDWAKAFVEGFPVPELEPVTPGTVLPVEVLTGSGWRHWVGYLDGGPVATAAAFVDDMVHVEWIACVPEARGRGVGAALTAAATSAAPDLPAALIASDLGRPVYQRLGYEPIARFTLWEGRRTG